MSVRQPSLVAPPPEMLASSESIEGWGGFPVFLSRTAEVGVWGPESIAHPFLSVIIEGCTSVSIGRGGKSKELILSPGSVLAYPAGQHWDQVDHRGKVKVVSIAMTWAEASRTFREPSEPLLHNAHPHFSDESTVAIVNALFREIATGGHTGPLYSEALCLALAERLSAIDRGELSRQLAGGLSSFAMVKVRTYIEEHLDQPLTIAELAVFLQVKDSQFAAAFKRSFGVTVHKFIVGRRLERAKRLLQSGHSVTEVSFVCGFANQSHFTEAFRKATGVTPAAYQRAERSSWTFLAT